MARLDELRVAVAEFERLQRKYRKYGASDTEPCVIFRSILRKAAAGDSYHTERDASGWELYVDEAKSVEAAVALSTAALLTVSVITNCPLRESKAVRKYVADYCG